MQKKLCALLFCVLGFLPLAAFAQTEGTREDSPQSFIRFQTQKIDIGDTLYRKETTYLYVFVYENQGTAPLIVNKVSCACPCIRVDFSTDPLPPGQTDTLKVYFTPSHASRYTQRLTVFTNSPNSGTLLYVKGTFLKPSEWRARKESTAPQP